MLSLFEKSSLAVGALMVVFTSVPAPLIAAEPSQAQKAAPITGEANPPKRMEKLVMSPQYRSPTFGPAIASL